MLKINRELNRKVNCLFEFASSLNRGDILNHDAIENVTGETRYQGHWKSIIHKFRKKMLKEIGIALRPITDVGYKLCTKDEQLKWCAYNRQRRMIRQANRGFAEMKGLDHEDLSLHQMQLKARTEQNLISERRAIKHGMRDQRSFVGRHEALPIRPREMMGPFTRSNAAEESADSNSEPVQQEATA